MGQAFFRDFKMFGSSAGAEIELTKGMPGRVVSKHLPCFFEWLYILLRRSSATWSNSGSVNTERQVALIHTQHMYPNYKMYYAYESAMEGSKSIRKHESKKA